MHPIMGKHKIKSTFMKKPYSQIQKVKNFDQKLVECSAVQKKNDLKLIGQNWNLWQRVT